MNRIILSTLCVLAAACTQGAAHHPPEMARAASCEGSIVMGDRELDRYRGCQDVSGELALWGVSSLAPLASLRSVDGTLRIEHTARLYTLAGLEQLRTVHGLEIHHNSALINVGALRNLEQARHVSVSYNPRLSATYGFLDGITRGDLDLDLAQNSGLAAEGVKQPVPAGSVAAR